MHNHLKALSCCFILLAGCSDDKKPTVSKNDHVNNVVDQLLSQKTASKPKYSEITPDFLEQNWNQETRMEWWYTSQGSRLLPYAWFLALEQADSEALLSSKEHLQQYRFIAGTPDKNLNPDNLPIGFVADKDANESRYLGFTCAACHTGKIAYKGKEYIVEGAPAHHDFDRFITEVSTSLQKTTEHSDKFSRFASRVLGAKASPDDLAALKALLSQENDKLGQRVKINHPPYENGYARLDAFGNIFNEVAVIALNEPSNAIPANKTAEVNAPVSYPMLWDTPQHDVVQWNGAAVNAGIGSYVRNASEVVGVFGNLSIQKTQTGESTEIGFRNHINFKNAGRLEELLTTLWSPLWPNTLPAIDPIKAQQGKLLFESQCISCHHDIKRDDPLRKVMAKMIPVTEIGTDPKTAMNIAERSSVTGILEGQPVLPLSQFVPNLPNFGKTAPTAELVVYAVMGSLRDDLDPHTFGAGLPTFLDAAKKSTLIENCDPKQQGDKCNRPASYKARPLNGIWASAPYFHNGSVPNLWELLQKPEQRVRTFNVGSWEFDPVNVGFVSNEEQDTSTFDTTIEGNANTGHLYGSDLSVSDKWLLIEYLKTL